MKPGLFKKNGEGERSLAAYLITSLSMPIFTFAIFLVAFVYFMHFSFGWFAPSNRVSDTGMTVKTGEDGNLIIGETASDATDKASLGDAETIVHFTLPNGVLHPATRISGSLKYVTNIDDIDTSTGTFKASASPVYADAEENVHYIRYRVYLGTSAKDYEYSEIDVKIDPESCYFQCAAGSKVQSGKTYYSYDGEANDFVEETALDTGDDASDYYTRDLIIDAHKALCVDVYYGDVYKGTLNAGSDNTVKVTEAAGTLSTSAPAMLEFVCYFDGAMTDGSGTTLIRSSTVSMAGANIGIEVNAPGTSG